MTATDNRLCTRRLLVKSREIRRLSNKAWLNAPTYSINAMNVIKESEISVFSLKKPTRNTKTQIQQKYFPPISYHSNLLALEKAPQSPRGVEEIQRCQQESVRTIQQFHQTTRIFNHPSHRTRSLPKIYPGTHRSPRPT